MIAIQPQVQTMKIDFLSSAGREIAHWRQFFRMRSAAGQAPPQDSDPNFGNTEWSNTEWSETLPDTLALSGPIDATENLQ